MSTGGSPSLRFDENQTIHAVADVHPDRRRRAVINVKPGFSALKENCEECPGAVNDDAAPPPGPVTACRSMLCGILLFWMIVQMKLHEVAFANADETSRHIAAERPEHIFHAVGQFFHHFFYFEIHDDFGGVRAFDRRRHIRRLREHGVFFANDCVVCGLDDAVGLTPIPSSAREFKPVTQSPATIMLRTVFRIVSLFIIEFIYSVSENFATLRTSGSTIFVGGWLNLAPLWLRL